MDPMEELAKKLFLSVDDLIRNTIINLHDDHSSLKDVYEIIMPLLSALCHGHLLILTDLFIENGSQSSRKEIFMNLLSQLNYSCQSGYDELSQTTTH
jgi:hypothetical protein